MSEQLLTILKLCLLALLYLFFFRVVRAVWAELRSAGATTGGALAAPARPVAAPACRGGAEATGTGRPHRAGGHRPARTPGRARALPRPGANPEIDEARHSAVAFALSGVTIDCSGSISSIDRPPT